MEFASKETSVEQAESADSQAITRLLRNARHTHLHVDWQLPVDWIGHESFVVYRAKDERIDKSFVEGGLAIIADPLPAAWVRVAVLGYEVKRPFSALSAMFNTLLPILSTQGVSEIGWLAIEQWLGDWLPDLGFYQKTAIETLVNENFANSVRPTAHLKDVIIRPALDSDFPRLAELEVDSFAPIWRHSENALRFAARQAFSFDVAEVEGIVVGFQLSTQGISGAHLARMTVAKNQQGCGIGSALLHHAFVGYTEASIKTVSLNTEIDNTSAQQLYAKFGFSKHGFEVPVWAKTVESG